MARHSTRLTRPARSGRGKQARLGRTWSTLKPSSRRGNCRAHLPCSPPADLAANHRYNDDISLEDAIHTALLTLKEGFEGQMTEKTIEIGIVTVPTEAELVPEVGGRVKPSFRKLTEEEVRDYLAL